MRSVPLLPRVLVLAALLGAAPSARPVDKADLDRITPVPADQPIPVHDFFRRPLLRQPKFNAAGTHFAAIVDVGDDHTALMVCDLAKQKLSTLRGMSKKDFDSVTWLDNDNMLASMSSEKLYAEGLVVAKADDLNSNYPIESYSATMLIAVPPKQPMKPLVWIFRDAYADGNDSGVVKIDASKSLSRGRSSSSGPTNLREKMEEESDRNYGTRASIIDTFAAPPGGVVVAYWADREGNLAFAETSKDGRYTLHRLEHGKWLPCPVDLEEIDTVTVGNAAGEMLVVGPGTAGAPRPLQMLDAVNGKLGETVFQDKLYDPVVDRVQRHPVNGGILGVVCDRGREVSVWFDENYRAVQKLLESKFPGHVVILLGSDATESRFFLTSYSDREPPSYFSLDVKTMTLALIKRSKPWIDPQRMQTMNLMRFKTRDGRQLDAYVTLPAGATKEKPPPLVVLPHGGPHARDSWGFDGEVQFLASRGYAVLQPNYRGSTGYSWMFPAEDYWDFRKMHNDVTDAVKTLVAAGLVDPRRMAIMGTSFGGYLALCGATLEPDLYRCAVTISGVFDWEKVMAEAKYERYDTAEYDVLRRHLGDPSSRRDLFDAISPVRHVDQVKIPVFVAHGREDEVAKVGESKRLLSELEKHHVPHEAMLAWGEGHGMHNLDNEVELYTRIEAFLAKNLAPAP